MQVEEGTRDGPRVSGEPQPGVASPRHHPAPLAERQLQARVPAGLWGFRSRGPVPLPGGSQGCAAAREFVSQPVCAPGCGRRTRRGQGHVSFGRDVGLGHVKFTSAFPSFASLASSPAMLGRGRRGRPRRCQHRGSSSRSRQRRAKTPPGSRSCAGLGCAGERSITLWSWFGSRDGRLSSERKRNARRSQRGVRGADGKPRSTPRPQPGVLPQGCSTAPSTALGPAMRNSDVKDVISYKLVMKVSIRWSRGQVFCSLRWRWERPRAYGVVVEWATLRAAALPWRQRKHKAVLCRCRLETGATTTARQQSGLCLSVRVGGFFRFRFLSFQ